MQAADALAAEREAQLAATAGDVGDWLGTDNRISSMATKPMQPEPAGNGSSQRQIQQQPVAGA
jgi:hypothetical protein